ncbi:MAG: ATP-binding cassette domain-containing protein [Gammaproteobacteria bacterium]|nr:ATP-binding cassette domain-containing protein [Gammaproteobacteria bacterium]
MTLLNLDTLSLDFGDQPILRNASLTIDEGERICLIGRNGAGKSTLLKLIMGSLPPDSGEVRRRQDLRISQLEQALPSALQMTVRDFVTEGLGQLQALLQEYEHRSGQVLDDEGMRRLEVLQRDIETEGGWNLDQRIDSVLSELSLPGDERLSALSGGWQRRVALAKALVCQPDLLLLDEPTNHLDLASIQWLEDRIRAWRGSVLFITHDRAFLQRLATRIVELDRARLTSWPGDYQNFLRRKEESLNAEALERGHFEKKLAEEEVWVRQGIKARRTRNEGRVRALEAMRREYTERQRFRVQQGPRMHIEETVAESGRMVIEMEHVSHGYEGEPLINDFSLKVMRGDRIGLIGNNGVGKSTLLKIMLGELQPQSGRVRMGTQLQIAYFDQLRRALDEERSVAEIVGEGRDHVQVDGKPRHIIGYLGGFLFSPARTRTPIRALSGGERNRVILARLFTRPSNLLVLDEPTNDLDVETLEVLEERLVAYTGTLIIVSHDREFIDNVVTSTLVFEADGGLRSYAGGYSDWARRGRALAEREAPQSGASDTAATADATSAGSSGEPAGRPAPSVAAAATPSRARLSYKLQRELDGLPSRIKTLEDALAALDARIGAQGFYEQPWDDVQRVLDEREAQNSRLESLLERWLALSDN